MDRIRCTAIGFLYGLSRELFTALYITFSLLLSVLSLLLFSLLLVLPILAHLQVLEVACYRAQPLHMSGWPFTAVKLPQFCIMHEWISVYYCGSSSSTLHVKINFRQIAQPQRHSSLFSEGDTLYFRKL